MGGATMQATLLTVSSAIAPEVFLESLRRGLERADPAVYGAASLLPNDCGAWARLLAHEGAAMTGAVEALWTEARQAVTGTYPQPRRK